MVLSLFHYNYLGLGAVIVLLELIRTLDPKLKVRKPLNRDPLPCKTFGKGVCSLGDIQRFEKRFETGVNLVNWEPKYLNPKSM